MDASKAGRRGNGGAGAAVVWFRTDLRAEDHPALFYAADSARRAGVPVVGLFVVSPGQWRQHDCAAVKVDFVLRNAAALRQRLEGLGIPMVVRHAARLADVPGVVDGVLAELRAGSVWWTKEYEVDEARRDAAVARMAQDRGMKVHAVDGQVVVEPGAVLTQGGTPFTVFTPFKRAWIREVVARGVGEVLAAPRAQMWPELAVELGELPVRVEGFESAVPAELWAAGEGEASARLGRFVRERIGMYKDRRDFPDAEGTSALSPYLAAGVISARRCVVEAMKVNAGRLSDDKRMQAAEGPAAAGGAGALGAPGPSCWISELVWREFYKHIVFHFPRVCMGRAFRPETEKIKWVEDERLLAAWQQGRTGYPIVDAAQRALLATGWMHNRLRMISAMFLSKDLFLDWRLGERHFMRNLVDGDLASNNGGWQWSASTGTDAAPYFRIFNPASQSSKFDAEGRFIKKWCPELAKLNGPELHEPGLLGLRRHTVDYPEPVVDHAAARERVLRAFGAENKGEEWA